MSAVQTLTLAGKQFVVLEQAEYERLRTQAGDATPLPELPTPNSAGHVPAVAYARASLARKLIRRRWGVGLSQAELARRSGIRPETLNRIEKGKTTPDTATVEKIVRVLERVEAAELKRQR